MLSEVQYRAAARAWPELGADADLDLEITKTALDYQLINNFVNFKGGDFHYAYHLVEFAKAEIDGPFQAFLLSLFPDNYTKAKVKSVGRTFVKATVDYLVERQPRAACVVDIVRCMLLFYSCRELLDAYAFVKTKFVVLGVKNSFADENPQFGSVAEACMCAHAMKHYMRSTTCAAPPRTFLRESCCAFWLPRGS